MNDLGINGILKKEEVIDVFRKRKFEFVVLTEKLKGNEDISWCEVSGINSGVHMRG